MGEMNWADMHRDAMTVLTGDFPVVITEAVSGKSQNGKAMIKCTLKIESGPYAGRSIKNNFTVSPESPVAMKMFFINLKHLGLGDAYFAQNPSLEQIAGDLLGRRATVTLESREWQGVSSENVKNWKPALAGGGLVGMTAAPLTAAVLPAVVTATEAPEDPF